ncbi:hypothetical protein [uncultured Amnibacterium sp.]|uniref:hypothetical protein n=1 Tax=uncultured Amnibacterium sp. TaxID=1631851 RepID=UPI0035CB1225
MSPVRGYFRAVRRGAAAPSPRHEESAIATLAPHPTARPETVPERGRRLRLSAEPTPALRWVLALLLLWLLVGPRVELPAALHGLRVEDLVFVALGALCVLHLRVLGRPGPPTLAIAGVAAAGLISAGVASARGMVEPVTAMLYAVRPLEYWIAFPAALLLLHGTGGLWRRRIDSLLVVVTVLQTLFAVLQYYFAIPIGFSHAAYTRAAGLTVGPYELGAISAALAVYWLSRGRWAMVSLSVVALAASISRISILGAAVGMAVFSVIWLVRITRRARRAGLRTALQPYRRSPLLIAGQVLSVVVAGLVLAFTVGLVHLPELPAAQPPAAEEPVITAAPSDEPTDDTEPEAETPPVVAAPVDPQAPTDSIATRLESTSVLGSWNAAGDMANRVPHPQTSGDYLFAAYAGMNIYVNANTAADAHVEASNLVRFFRWHLILDTFDDPADVVFGLGPSFAGPSVDGSYLRFFADGGLLGVLAWLALIVLWLRRTPAWMVCVTISLLVGALFIDIVYAQRPMVLYWLLLAVALTAPRPTKGHRAEAAAAEAAPAPGAAPGSAASPAPGAATESRPVEADSVHAAPARPSMEAEPARA